MTLATLLACSGNRYISADADLEKIYLGQSYYQIVQEFGRPSSTSLDNRSGTMAVYNTASLEGTSAARLYHRYNMRNRLTKQDNKPEGRIVFSFDQKMRCYGVDSDFEREKNVDYDPDNKAVDLGRNPNRAETYKPQVPRTLDFPKVERRSPFAEVVSIERIEVLEDQTKVYFSYCDRTPDHRPLHDKGLTIHKDVFIRDCATNQHFKLIKPEGITLYPDYTPFTHYRGGYDMLVYTLIFEAIPRGAEFIDIVEPGAEGFNFYTVDVRTPKTFRQSLQPIPQR